MLLTFMRKEKAFPPSPQPKQWYICFSALTVNEGVFSLWNGHNPI